MEDNRRFDEAGAEGVPAVDLDGLPLDWEFLTADFEDLTLLDPMSPEGRALLPVIEDPEGLVCDLESGELDPDSLDPAVLAIVAPHLLAGSAGTAGPASTFVDPGVLDPRVVEAAEWDALGILPPERSHNAAAAYSALAFEDAAAIVREIEATEADQARLDARRVRLISRLVRIYSRSGNPVARMEAPALAASEVAAGLRIAQRTARARVEEALALTDERLAPALAAMRAGRLTRQRAAVLLDAAVPVPASRLAEFAEAATAVAAPEDRDRVPTMPALGRRLRRLAEDYADEALAIRREKAAADRRVDVIPAGDGMCHLTAFLPLETGAMIDTRLTAIARALQTPDEGRTVNQLRADVVSDLLAGLSPTGSCGCPDDSNHPLGGSGHPQGDWTAANEGGDVADALPALPAPSTALALPTASALPAPPALPAAPVSGRPSVLSPFGGVRMQLVVTASASTLDGTGDAPGELLGYGPVDAETTRRLAAQSSTWTRLVVGANGAPLSIGRIRYAPTAAMRRFLTLRDATCRFPGCDKPAAATEADHTTEWQDGGTTEVNNLALLCPEHHRLKSLGLWHVRHLGQSRVHPNRAARNCDGQNHDGPNHDGENPEGQNHKRSSRLAAEPEPSAPTLAPASAEPAHPLGALEWTGPSGRHYVTYPHAHEEAPPPF